MEVAGDGFCRSCNVWERDLHDGELDSILEVAAIVKVKMYVRQR